MSEERTLLRIDADPQIRSALSRHLCDDFIKQRRRHYPDTGIIHRDLAAKPLPTIEKDEDVGALYAPAETHTPDMARLAETSDRLVEELMGADEIVIATTMYNMTVPAILKNYIDLVVRGRRTFRFTPQGPVGLVHGKKLLLILTMGGIYSKGSQIEEDFLEPYLRSIFAFIGISACTSVRAEGLAIDAEARKKAVTSATAELKEHALNW